MNLEFGSAPAGSSGSSSIGLGWASMRRLASHQIIPCPIADLTDLGLIKLIRASPLTGPRIFSLDIYIFISYTEQEENILKNDCNIELPRLNTDNGSLFPSTAGQHHWYAPRSCFPRNGVQRNANISKQTGPTLASKSEKSMVTSSQLTPNRPDNGANQLSSRIPFCVSTVWHQVSTTANNATKE